jgi:hypothetical protein
MEQKKVRVISEIYFLDYLGSQTVPNANISSLIVHQTWPEHRSLRILRPPHCRRNKFLY